MARSITSNALARAALLAAIASAGCRSAQTGAAAGAVPVTRRVVVADLFAPTTPPVASTIDNFALPPWFPEGGECMPVRTAPNGAVFATVYYPTEREPQVLITLTVDAAGRLVQSHETRGVIRFRPRPGDTTRAGLDSALTAAQRATRSTTIGLDYVTDAGTLSQRGGGGPNRVLTVSTTAVADLPLLDHPRDHARAAARLCRVGSDAAGAAPLVSAPASRDLATPEAVARAFFDAIDAERWDAAVALVDSADLPGMRLQGLRSLLGWAKSGAHTVAKQAPGAPSNFGWSSSRDTTVRAADDTISVIGPGDSTTVGALARLAPRDFAARTLAAANRRGVGTIVFRVLGAVTEGDSVAHVVYRRDYAGAHVTTAAANRDMLHLRRVNGEWKVVATPPLFTASAIVQAAVNYQPPRERR